MHCREEKQQPQLAFCSPQPLLLTLGKRERGPGLSAPTPAALQAAHLLAALLAVRLGCGDAAGHLRVAALRERQSLIAPERPERRHREDCAFPSTCLLNILSASKELWLRASEPSPRSTGGGERASKACWLQAPLPLVLQLFIAQTPAGVCQSSRAPLRCAGQTFPQIPLFRRNRDKVAG